MVTMKNRTAQSSCLTRLIEYDYEKNGCKLQLLNELQLACISVNLSNLGKLHAQISRFEISYMTLTIGIKQFRVQSSFEFNAGVLPPIMRVS